MPAEVQCAAVGISKVTGPFRIASTECIGTDPMPSTHALGAYRRVRWSCRRPALAHQIFLKSIRRKSDLQDSYSMNQSTLLSLSKKATVSIQRDVSSFPRYHCGILPQKSHVISPGNGCHCACISYLGGSRVLQAPREEDGKERNQAQTTPWPPWSSLARFPLGLHNTRW